MRQNLGFKTHEIILFVVLEQVSAVVTIDSIDVEKAIQNAKALIAAEPDLSAGLKSALDVLLILVAVLVNRVTLTRNNSSKPPASDPNRIKTRQVVDLDIARVVTKYRAQILEGAAGKRFVARFPTGVSKAVQYGAQLKAHAVYLSQYQLLPYQRIQQYFADQL